MGIVIGGCIHGLLHRNTIMTCRHVLFRAAAAAASPASRVALARRLYAFVVSPLGMLVNAQLCVREEWSAEFLCIKLNPLLFVRCGHTVGLVIPFLPVSLHHILPEDLGDSLRVFDSLGSLGIQWVECPFLEEAVSDLRLSSQKDGCVAYDQIALSAGGIRGRRCLQWQ
jgi:hypothetical protein